MHLPLTVTELLLLVVTVIIDVATIIAVFCRFLLFFVCLLTCSCFFKVY